MKKLNYLFMAAAVILLTATQFGCKNPTEDVAIITAADFVSAPSTFVVLDAKTEAPLSKLEGATVTITGKDAGLIYTSDGHKTFAINNGIVNLCFRTGTVASNESPLKFNIVISDNSVLPVTYPVTMTSTDPVTETIYVVDAANLPGGCGKVSTSTSTDATGTTTTPKNVICPVSPTKTETATISIPAGVKMLDANGNPVSGTVSIDLVHFSGGDIQTAQVFGNATDLVIKDANGNPATEDAIEPAGWMDIKMSAGGSDVKTFSSPIKARIGIAADQINPVTGTFFAVGNVLDVLSQNEGGTEWKVEGTSTIAKDSAGNLYAEFNPSHLSKWLVGLKMVACIYKLQIPIPDYIKPSDYKYANLKGRVFYSLFKNMTDGRTASKSFSYNFNLNKFPIVGGNLELPIKFGAKPTQITSGVLNGSSKSISEFNSEQYAIESTQRFPACQAKISNIKKSKLETFQGYFRVRCTTGKTKYATLPEGSTIYVIKEMDFQAASTKPLLTSSAWKSFTVNAEVKPSKYVGWNSAVLNKADFVVGSDYRFVVIYGAKRYDYVYTTPSLASDMLVEISVPCE